MSTNSASVSVSVSVSFKAERRTLNTKFRFKIRRIVRKLKKSQERMDLFITIGLINHEVKKNNYGHFNYINDTKF